VRSTSQRYVAFCCCSKGRYWAPPLAGSSDGIIPPHGGEGLCIYAFAIASAEDCRSREERLASEGVVSEGRGCELAVRRQERVFPRYSTGIWSSWRLQESGSKF